MPTKTSGGVLDALDSFDKTMPTSLATAAYPVHWEKIQLQKHIPIIFKWVQLPYAHAFWQMDHFSFDELYDHYATLIQCGHATSLIGYYLDKPVCQVEVYECCYDELSRYYPARTDDIGIHFLMAPICGDKIEGLSATMMKSVLGLLFSCKAVIRIMGEPDSRNTKANALVRHCGFRFIKPISMSYKEANLYECDREHYIPIT